MTIRRAVNYSRDIEKLRAARDLRSLYVQRAAQHADKNEFERFGITLERIIDKNAGKRIIKI